MMRAEIKALRLIQLVVVLLSVPLDAFALAPGRINGPRCSSRQHVQQGADTLNGGRCSNKATRMGPPNGGCGAGAGAASAGATRVTPATCLQAELVGISGGGGGQVRTKTDDYSHCYGCGVLVSFALYHFNNCRLIILG